MVGTVLRAAIGFFAVLGLAVAAFAYLIIGPPSNHDMQAMQGQWGQIYVRSLEKVESTARRLRKDFCATEDRTDPACA